MTQTTARIDTLREDRLTQWRVQGDWVLSARRELLRLTQAPLPTDLATDVVDLSALGQLDTAGAEVLLHWLGTERSALWLNDAHLSPERRALIDTLRQAQAQQGQATPRRRGDATLAMLEGIGRNVVGLARTGKALMGFIGLALESLARTAWRPHRWRLTPLAAQIEQVGLNAVPLVLLLTFLIGAVVAFLGATVLRDFGANQFAVHLVAFSFLREFGVLLTAILMAGRTASAFTAQIGAMKANEEIDALRTLGLDPMELLVLPRLLAMVVSLPLLTFLAMVSGIFGGALVCVGSLGLSPNLFLSILQTDIAVRHFYVGMGKAPVFAAVIALVGCLEGFKSGSNARSVGEHTTSSVVQSIFLVILLDAIAALFFMEMKW